MDWVLSFNFDKGRKKKKKKKRKKKKKKKKEKKSYIMFQPSICPHPSFPSFLVVAELSIQLLRDSDRLLSLATVSDRPASKVGKRFVFLGLATCRSCMKSLKETALISSIPRGSRIFLLLTFLLLVLLSNQKKRRKKEEKKDTKGEEEVVSEAQVRATAPIFHVRE